MGRPNVFIKVIKSGREGQVGDVIGEISPPVLVLRRRNMKKGMPVVSQRWGKKRKSSKFSRKELNQQLALSLLRPISDF